MSDMLKITAAETSKNYMSQSKPLVQSNAVFDLADLSKVVKTNDRTSDFRETDNSFTSDKNAALDTNLKLTKDTSYLSKIISNLTDQINYLSQEELPDVSSKQFNEFVKNLFLPAESITEDIIAQEKGITNLRGELFDILRNMLATSNSQETIDSISCFLRHFSTLSSQSEILHSISSNLKYLSELLSPSKTLSENLFNLSKLFTQDIANFDFEALKHQAVNLLNSASTSLIATDKITSLISLIKYNISRFSNNTEILTSSFNSLLSLVNDEATQQQLINAFEKMIEKSNMPFNTKAALLTENNLNNSADKITFQLAQAIANNKIALSEDLQSNEAIVLVNLLNENENISLSDGAEKIKNILSLIIPEDNQQRLSEFIKSFENTKDLNSLINRIRYMISQVSSENTKQQLASSLNKVLTLLSQSPEVAYQPPTSMETLIEFMQNSLGNQNIKYLGIVDPNTLIQNMLTSPGVFTPLMHYIVPVKIGNMRTFGELWVDNDSENFSETKKDFHLFLSFDIENQGLFELEIFASNKDLDISLYCPKKFVKPLSSVKQSIQTIAFSKGFNITKSKISELKKARTLTQIFPSVEKRRAGLDVTI